MSALDDALTKHGSAVEAVAAGVGFEGWPIGDAMRLLAMMAREMAAAEIERRRRA
jgi:hypothetical protein